MIPQVLNPSDLIDRTFWIIFGFQIVVLTGLTLATIYFLFRYHHTRNQVPEPIEGNFLLEVLWTTIPVILVMGMFYSGWVGFKAERTVPADAFPIKAVAKKWVWNFEYPNGKKSKTLIVPQRKPTKMLLTSLDVLHSFYMPAFRIKMDVVPGRETYTWFYPENIGTFTLYCAEYCGLRHSKMLASVGVATQTDFDAWYKIPNATATLEMAAGEKILDKKGCLACHSLDGSEIVGPTFLEIWGRKSTVFEYPETKMVTADEDYIARSVQEPSSQIVEGFDNVMPKLDVSADELKEIITFFKTLK